MGTPPVDGDLASIQDFERELRDALLQSDTEALDRMYSDDFVYVHASAHTNSKSHFLGRLAEGELKFTLIENDDVDVRIYGDSAVVTGRAEVLITKMRTPVIRRFTRVYIRSAGQWRIVAHHSSGAPSSEIGEFGQ